MRAETILKGEDRLNCLLKVIDGAADENCGIWLKVEEGEGAAFIRGSKIELKIFTENWKGGDPEHFPDKNRLL